VQDKKSRNARAGDRITVTTERVVTHDRRDANVVTTDYMRKLRQIVLVRTPFGALIGAHRIDDVKALIEQHVNRKIAEYNAGAKRTCRLANCVLWEHLRGVRLAAVAGWIDAQLARGNEDVVRALPGLVVSRKQAA
jgi:hypothetical protein